LLSRPSLDRLDDEGGLLSAHGRYVRQGRVAVAAGERVRVGKPALDVIQLADEVDDLGAGRSKRLGLHVLSAYVCPAEGECVAWHAVGAGPRDGLVGLVPVGHHDAVVVAQHFSRRRRRPAGKDPVHDRGRRGHRPRVPLLGRVLVQHRPVRLIDVDERGRKRLGQQRLVALAEVLCQELDLVPQRLAVDDQIVGVVHPHLALERQVVQVLRDGHVHGEVHRVPSALDQLERPGRRHRRAAVLTTVLLPSVLAHDELPLDDGDLFGLLALPLPLGQRLTTLGADAIRFIKLVRVLLEGQLRLLAAPVAIARRWRHGRGFLRLPLFARRAEHVLPQRRHLLLQPHQLQLELLLPVLALELGDLRDQLLQARMQPCILLLEQQRRLLHQRRVFELLDGADHISLSSHRDLHGKAFVVECRRHEHFSSDQLAALEKQRQLAQRERHRRAGRALPRPREATTLEPLRQQAKPRAVEVQHLRPARLLPDEQIDVAVDQPVLHLVLDQRRQAIEALAQIDRCAVREHAHDAGQADHGQPTSRSSAAAVATSGASIR